ncbi:hypothetical protein NECAME_07106 [Necator americanus]|uniref:Uncharacterized protein n=1 Tax=Necator americanus TaxID=51031 RepID=W2TPK0_NECAM|nr:hypothetical protein NECAME_07106 [Necator americanus]ETN84010.1 hypothetical protein NECAME_07106 [Necator americanus]
MRCVHKLYHNRTIDYSVNLKIGQLNFIETTNNNDIRAEEVDDEEKGSCMSYGIWGRGMDQLDKLVSRLETVTAKLENLGSTKPQLAPKPVHLGGNG